MFRSAGIFFVATMLLTSTGLAQQRWSGQPGHRDFNRPWHDQNYRPPGAWGPPAVAGLVLAPLLGLLLQPRPVIVAPVAQPAGPPPGGPPPRTRRVDQPSPAAANPIR
jgi:hypothetical protein